MALTIIGEPSEVRVKVRWRRCRTPTTRWRWTMIESRRRQAVPEEALRDAATAEKIRVSRGA